MSRNGSGVYTLPPGINPVTQDTTITSNWANTTLSDIAAALTQSLARDGQTVPVANLPMGGFRHTGVGNPTARNQYASLGWVQDGYHIRLTSVGGTNDVSGQLIGNPTSLQTGQLIQVTPTATNTGDVTLNVNNIGPKQVVRPDGEQLDPGEWAVGYPHLLAYDGTKFVALTTFPALTLPETATRWPTFNEVTDKPNTATRWPTFNEVTNKPSSYPPSAHSDHQGLRNISGYFEIESFNQTSYGVGKAQMWWDANNARLNVGGRDGNNNAVNPEVKINNLILRSEPTYSRFFGNSNTGISVANNGTQVLGSASSLIRWSAGSNDFDISSSRSPEFNGNPIWHRGNCARVFTQSSDPGSAAQDGDLWVW